MTEANGDSLFAPGKLKRAKPVSPEAEAKRLRSRVERERTARREAEQLLEQKSRELYDTNVQLKEFASDLEFLVQERTAALQTSIAQIEEQNRAAEHAARHDALTGLPNRRYVSEFLRENADTLKRAAIISIDLDRFKQINDTLGHAAGDELLCVVADRLGGFVPEDALIARMGGDEFVIILVDERPNGAATDLATMIVRCLPEPVLFNGNVLRFGASAGIARHSPVHASHDELLIESDLALYQAKERGRGCAVEFSDEMRTSMLSRRQLSEDLIIAFEEDHIRPFYQPRISVTTGDIACVEALARWHHPKRGLLQPGQFLPIAEDIGRLADIDERILEHAIQDLESWDRAGLSIPRFSVNVSGRRLLQDDLFDRLDRMDLPAGRLSFELLESIFFEDADQSTFDRLFSLRARGIDIEIDDFGSGHASINGLLAVMPDSLKIDRKLVCEALKDAGHEVLLLSVVQIGQSLGIKVVAEGVETGLHAELCEKLKCDQMQGYAVSKPIPADQLAAFARSIGPTRKRA